MVDPSPNLTLDADNDAPDPSKGLAERIVKKASRRMWRRVIGIWVLVFGMLVLLAAFVEISEHISRAGGLFEHAIEVAFDSSAGIVDYYYSPFDAPTFALWLMGGSAFTGLAILYLTKRFSLRTLLVVMGVVAGFGAIPWILAPSGVKHCRVAFVLTDALTTDQTKHLHDRLVPRAALATWPEPLRKELDVHPTEQRADVAFVEIKGRRLLSCVVKLAPHLDSRARKTVAEFYYEYGTFLIQKEVGGPGAPIGKPMSLGIGGVWDDWRDKWWRQGANKPPP